MDDKIIICRCEDITVGEIKKLVSMGLDTIEELKRVTRCGMGSCQGRTCQGLLQSTLRDITGKPVSQIKPHKFRPPSKPVPLGIFGGEHIEE